MSDPCQQRIAAAHRELFRLNQEQQLGIGDEDDDLDSPLGRVNLMVGDAQTALDRGNEERCQSLIEAAEKALAGLER